MADPRECHKKRLARALLYRELARLAKAEDWTQFSVIETFLCTPKKERDTWKDEGDKDAG